MMYMYLEVVNELQITRQIALQREGTYGSCKSIFVITLSQCCSPCHIIPNPGYISKGLASSDRGEREWKGPQRNA